MSDTVPLVLRLLTFLVGASLLVATIRSSIRTVVVPRGERVFLTRVMFGSFRSIYRTAARRHRQPERRHAVMSRYAPMTTMFLAGIWAAGVITSFALMFWAMTSRSFVQSFELSGSSFTTLGFAQDHDQLVIGFIILEAIMGLGIVALLISYMPTIYGHFSRREELVLKFEVLAGGPPRPEAFLTRVQSIGWTARLGTIWDSWESWFEQLEESHTSQPALPFLRSQHPVNSWVTTAGAVLDTIAIVESSLDLPREPQGAITLRAGFLALQSIAHFYGAPIEVEPAPNDPISISRAEFDGMLDRLAESGLPVRTDREQAWRDFAGWRVNYDRSLLALCELCDAPDALWSSDRSDRFVAAPSLFRMRDWRMFPAENPPSW